METIIEQNNHGRVQYLTIVLLFDIDYNSESQGNTSLSGLLLRN